MSDTKKAATSEGFSAEERAAMKEHAKELKANANKATAEKQVLEVIAEMPERDRALAERLHALVTASAPELSPKLWYGSPAYAKDGNVICFFQVASKYDTRYLNFGFSDSANLDEGGVWATSFAVVEMTAADEAMIGKLVVKAAR